MSFINKYQKFCYKLLGDKIQGNKKLINNKLRNNLAAANIGIREDAYMAYTIMNTLLAALIGVFLILIGIPLLPFVGIILPLPLAIILLLSPILAAGIVYFYHIVRLRFIANNRAKKIEFHMPYALNFIAAMSAAGVSPSEVIKSLAKQSIYGEVSEEAALMERDIFLMGNDIISAMQNAVERTPSKKFKEFLQGAVITVTSGGALKPYFMSKADQYMKENKRVQRKFNESLGIMAESYVTTAVAGVLMILIIIPLMSIMTGGGGQIFFMYFIIFLMLPLVHIGFAVTIKSMTPEV